ncbi:MAG: hypothetical protein ACTH58_04935 [Marinomonas foliarum]|uniref:hypothetical protein n=1 Tax=Marinomonas foliarum TaxID=491950 RepID=UPI003F971DC5
MKVKVHSPSDAIVNGKVKKLTAGEHDLPESAARKLVKNGVANFVVESTATKATKPTKAASDEA